MTRYGASGVPRLRTIWVEGGDEAQWPGDWVRGLPRTHKVALAVVEHTGKGWQGVPYPWVVERSPLSYP